MPGTAVGAHLRLGLPAEGWAAAIAVAAVVIPRQGRQAAVQVLVMVMLAALTLLGTV